MSKRSKGPYWCPKCDRELWPSRDGHYYTCPAGCLPMLSLAMCRSLTSTKAQREQAEKAQAEYKAFVDSAKQLPLCGVSRKLDERQRKKDLWWVDGHDGHFLRVGYGFINNCVHAIDVTKRYSRKHFFVSLRKATTEELERMIFGDRL